jgi:DNA-directed RNA polymerase specialized sigma24 family protein
VFAQEYLDYLYTVVEKMPYRYRNEVVAEVLVYVSDRDIDLSSRVDPKKYIRNLAYRLLGNLKNGNRCLPLLFDVPDKVQPKAIFKLDLGDLSEAVSELPPNLKETLGLLLDGKSISEIADIFSITHNGVWRRISRIRHQLKKWAVRNFPDMGELL